MKHTKPIILFLLCCFIIACASKKTQVNATSSAILSKKQALTDEEKKDWYFKDIYEDSIPGISLHKAYDFLKDKKGDTIIVAVIDTELAIDHEDLKDQVWVNEDEIPNNNIDDDNNGYIDDIHGWNYVGTVKGDSLPYTSFSYTRMVSKYELEFKNKTIDNVIPSKKSSYNQYIHALEEYGINLKQKTKELNFYTRVDSVYSSNDSILKKYFFNKPYTLEDLDSLKNITSDEKLIKVIKKMVSYISNGATGEVIKKEKREVINYLKLLDKERAKDGFNNNILGNNNIQGTYSINHATKVTGVLAAKRNNGIGINGINDKIKIMPISIIPYGDPSDKNIALAIRYAVNNDAKIINMSFSNYYSLNSHGILEAIAYAEKAGVLIVRSAGNESFNLDQKNIYPDDNEIYKNLIVVASSSFVLNEKLVADFSNYGKEKVDVFAAGKDMKVLIRKKIKSEDGTSLSAAIVTGIASLIFSHYPNLSASEVKQIIMESGVSYDIMVNKPSTSKEKELVPFSSLSKSGKIVNAYNALLMAEEVSKKKKRK